MTIHPASSLLSVRGLRVQLQTPAGPVGVLRGVDMEVGPGEIVGLVGESGSGKTMTSLAILGMLPPGLRMEQGTITFEGRDILRLSPPEMQALRGGRVAMIFQDPVRHLNPVFTIGEQLMAVIRAHERGLPARAVRQRAIELLRQVQIVEPEARLRSYPHQFSGGMAQRVMIAMALAGSPSLLLADEPTAALDVTIQAEILRLLRRVARERNMAVIFISHNLGAVWQFCDRVCVMYAGQIVEQAPTPRLMATPSHPYTQALLAALPRLSLDQTRLANIRGMAPAPADLPSGCAFHPRCTHARVRCESVVPDLMALEEDHRARCLYAGELAPLVEATA